MAEKIAIVTDEFAGVTVSGGIGTCANGLAKILSAAGYTVDIIITDAFYFDDVSNHEGYNLKSVSSWMKENEYAESDHVARAYAVYEILSVQTYDMVHFNDWRGSGYFYAMARRQGLVTAQVVSHLHGPTRWVREYNQHLAELETLELEALERYQIEYSDYTISPSQYLIDWYDTHGFRLPEARVINWFLPDWPISRRDAQSHVLKTKEIQGYQIKELIFFGRHERRKGFDVFIEALAAEPHLRNLDITFVGRFDKIDNEFTGSKAMRVLEEHSGSIKFLNKLDRYAAYRYIDGRSSAIVVMPSLIENSPCTVGECFTIGIPFIASSAGGIPELFEPSSRDQALVPPNADALAKKLVAVISNGLPGLHSTLRPSEILDCWLSFHEEKLSTKKSDARAPSAALVSVCLVHHNRPDLLRRALYALSQQTYKNFEVIVVDDGSDMKYAADLNSIERQDFGFSLSLIRAQNKYLGAARNLAAAHARGDYLVFHDDDNISEPHQLEIFVKAAESGGFDILTAQYLVFDDKEGPDNAKIRYFPMGVGGSFSLFRNRFGDANAIIKTSLFNRIGKFTELRGIGWEDWEFFLRAYQVGCKFGLVPVPLFRYRVNHEGMLATTHPIKNHGRIIDAIDILPSEALREVVAFAKREKIRNDILDFTWNLLKKIKLSELHLELTALDPNSDEARQKLMELAFEMGRVSDAMEIGLGLTNGFYRVDKLATLLGPKVKLYGRSRKVTGRIKSVDENLYYVEGWLNIFVEDLSGLIFFANEYYSYKLLVFLRKHRPDVNLHLQLNDAGARGFVAIIDKNNLQKRRQNTLLPWQSGQWNSNFTQAKFAVSDSDEPINVGVKKLPGQELSLIGHVDKMFQGVRILVEAPMNFSDVAYNRATILAEPDQVIYFYIAKRNFIQKYVVEETGILTIPIVPGGHDLCPKGEVPSLTLFLEHFNPDMKFLFHFQIDNETGTSIS